MYRDAVTDLPSVLIGQCATHGCARPVPDKRLVLGVRHFEFREQRQVLLRLDRELPELILDILVIAAEPGCMCRLVDPR